MREESPHLVQHPIQKVDIILTKSMFKGCGWLNESGMSWEDYWAVFRKYRHALYITNISKKKQEKARENNGTELSVFEYGIPQSG